MGEVIKVVVGMTICLLLVKSCLTVDPNKDSAKVASEPPPSTNVESRSPSSLRPLSEAKPEEKSAYLNYKKGEPSVAITCREIRGKVECKPAK